MPPCESEFIGKSHVVVHTTSVHRWDDVRIFQRQARSLAAAGYRVHLIAADRVAKADRFASHGVAVHLVRRPRGRLIRRLVTAPYVVARAVSIGATVLHVHDPELFPWALLARIAGVRVVVDLHEDYPAVMREKSWIPKSLRSFAAHLLDLTLRVVVRQADALVCADRAITQSFRSWTNRRPVASVENFPESDRFTSPDLAVSEARYSTRVVLFLGGINEARAIVPFVRAAALIKRTDCKILVGGRVASPKLLAEVSREPGWRRIDYLGEVPSKLVPELLASCSLSVVLFSDSPNHMSVRSNRLYESLAAGAPVLVSQFPEWTKLVSECKCGFFVDPSDERAIAAAIEDALADPCRLARFGSNGRHASNELFSWRSQEKLLLALYSQLLGTTHNETSHGVQREDQP